MKRVGILLMVMLVSMAVLFTGCGTDKTEQEQLNQGQTELQQNQMQQNQDAAMAEDTSATNADVQAERAENEALVSDEELKEQVTE